MARIWAEANRRLDSEKPDITKDIRRVEAQMADVRGRVERYLEAFETGKLEPDVCNQKVRDLKARLGELEAERTDLEERRERMSLPEMDHEFLQKTLADFEEVLASAENAKKKHLLRQLVKKVLVHSRDTVEVWYRLPGPDPARIAGIMAPQTRPFSEPSHRPRSLSRMPDAPWSPDPDVWFDHATGVIMLRRTFRLPVQTTIRGGCGPS